RSVLASQHHLPSPFVMQPYLGFYNNRIGQASHTAESVEGHRGPQVEYSQESSAKHGAVWASIDQEFSRLPHTMAGQDFTTDYRPYNPIVTQQPLPINAHKCVPTSRVEYNAESARRLQDGQQSPGPEPLRVYPRQTAPLQRYKYTCRDSVCKSPQYGVAARRSCDGSAGAVLVCARAL